MSKKNKYALIGPTKPKATPKRRMTREEEDLFLDKFPYLPKATPAEERLIASYAHSPIAHSLRNSYNAERGKTA
jgi:hypothetical protein